ncbi:MAG: hypothetical protein FD143_3770, partial [Ignavibacteria bacterium]
MRPALHSSYAASVMIFRADL